MEFARIAFTDLGRAHHSFLAHSQACLCCMQLKELGDHRARLIMCHYHRCVECEQQQVLREDEWLASDLPKENTVVNCRPPAVATVTIAGAKDRFQP